MKKIMIANGQYTAQDGQQKTRWVKVGIVGMSQNGKEYVLLDPTVNLAGFEREAGKDMLMASIFEDQPQNASHNSGQYSAPQNQQQNYQQQQQAPQQQYQPQNLQPQHQQQQPQQDDQLPF